MSIPITALNSKGAILAYWLKCTCRCQSRVSLRPMYVQRDDHATGLIRLLSIALRVLTLLEFSVRRQLTAEEATLSGLYAGNPKRETARPTAERLLEAFRDVTLTVVEAVGQIYRHLTVLSPLQERILELLGFSSRLYRRLCTVSHEPL
jgi:transposase